MLPSDTALRILSILNSRGLPPILDPYSNQWALANNNDGKGVIIELWDEVALGPQPTDADINNAVPYQESDAERIDAAFPQTDVAQVLFNVLFDMANQIRALQGNTALTKAQFKTYLQSQLP